MKLSSIDQLNSESIIDEALHTDKIEKLIRNARVQRNVYLVLFFISMCCIPIFAITERTNFTILALFLTTISLVIITKYDLHLMFLQIIRHQQLKQLQTNDEDEEELPQPDYP